MEAVLALLLVRAGQVVSMDALVAEIWGDRAPRRVIASLQVYVSNLRKLLAAPGREESSIVTRAPGYLLNLSDDELDLHDFQRFLQLGKEHARAKRHEQAVASFQNALALCRGSAFSGIEDIQAIKSFATWCDELRLECSELLFDSKLALGQHRDLIGDLHALVTDYPLREAFHRQLMLALYRSDRQADALAAYRSLRDNLYHELGLAPCRGLRDLQQAILVSDSRLEYLEAV
ncbi:BTAD domain-containing putative transcriptional regulator [Streptomyces sp. NPDC051644]|uniref:AfsR/SARP family transcriptional regulator n=1 Tax=Streptomyces sp. NPDC051644 TaxID=3365666 RepID=UPI00379452C3